MIKFTVVRVGKSFVSKAFFTNTGPRTISHGDWKIVFCCLFLAMPKKPFHVANNSFYIANVESNIFNLFPTDSFPGLNPGHTVSFNLEQVRMGADIFPNWYVTTLEIGGPARIIDSTKEGELRVDFSHVDVTVMSPEQRFNSNAKSNPALDITAMQLNVVPTPLFVEFSRSKPELAIPSWDRWHINCPPSSKSVGKYISSKYSCSQLFLKSIN